MSPSRRSGLSVSNPLMVRMVQPSVRAVRTALRIFGDLPEELIATKRSPAQA
jgi:hypothetical protein